mmetsp:Transcript_7880/g.10496  ORF Transcript_7880/g.10496 Transcript_7880/m.10496 type:complete len:173 (-) Transcript_7880:78-596(-)
MARGKFFFRSALLAALFLIVGVSGWSFAPQSNGIHRPMTLESNINSGNSRNQVMNMKLEPQNKEPAPFLSIQGAVNMVASHGEKAVASIMGDGENMAKTAAATMSLAALFAQGGIIEPANAAEFQRPSVLSEVLITGPSNLSTFMIFNQTIFLMTGPLGCHLQFHRLGKLND